MLKGAAMDNGIVIIFLLFFYFVPTVAANIRQHRSASAIGLLNLFLGWTVLGWLVALIWANTGNVEPPPAITDERVKCPDCRELVLKDASICKHCGCKLIPQ